MDVFLLVCLIALIIMFLLANVKLLFYYEHPDDKALWQAIFCKIMVLLGLLLAEILVLMLPMDVYNSRPGLSANLWLATDPQRPGGIDMQTFWIVVYCMIAFYLVIILPFSTYLYEADDDKRLSKRPAWQTALIYMFFTAAISGIIVGVSSIFLAFADIPIQTIRCNRSHAADDAALYLPCATSSLTNFRIGVKFEIYLISATCFVGWFLFVLFGGIGMSAIPLDLIIGFIDRPKAVDLARFTDKKKELGEKATALKAIADEIKTKELDNRSKSGWSARREKAKIQRDFNKLKQAVFLLEREWAHLNVAMIDKGENPLVSVAKLCLGVICTVISIVWILHILLYILIRPTGFLPISSFLNQFLTGLDQTGFYVISLVGYALLIFYLFCAVIKGCFKFGMRVFLFFPIHPMRPHETHMNSFIFNCGLILLSSTAIIQFSQVAFQDYARMTDADLIFSAQIQYLAFFKWFYSNNVFIYMLLIWSLLTTVYLLVAPRDSPAIDLNTAKASEHMQLRVNKMMMQKNQTPNAVKPSKFGNPFRK